MELLVLSVQGEEKKVSTESQIYNSIYKILYTKKVKQIILNAIWSRTAGLEYILTISIWSPEQHIYMPYMYIFSIKECLSLPDKNKNIRFLKRCSKTQEQQRYEGQELISPSVECLQTQSLILFSISFSDFISFMT